MDKVNPEENRVEEVAPKRGRGRPKTKIDEPKEPQKRGPKGDKSKHKEYYSQYYRDNYQNVFLPCPNCNKPVQKCKLPRHMRGRVCANDQIIKKYMNKFNQPLEKNSDVICDIKLNELS
jgi:hypothetical protein